MEDKDGIKTSLGKKNLIQIEYCINCQSHNWNTHHNQAKYHQTYIKLKNLIEQLFKQQTVIVTGNKVPHYLLPIKQQQNKYYNSNSKKYVIFPNVGSFQVSLNGQTIFSKKKTNTWPNFQTVLNDLSIKILQKPLPKVQKPKIKIETLQFEEPQIQTQQKDEFQQNRTVYTQQKINAEKKFGGNFTLTDHFKTFHQQNFPKVQVDSYHFDSSSTIKQAPMKNRIDVGDIQGLRKALKTPNSMNKNKTTNNNEILVDLSSIQEQRGQNNQTNYFQSINLHKKTSVLINPQLQPIISINSSEKSLSLLKFQDFSKDLKNIEKRFQNIEKKINLKEKANETKNSLQMPNQKVQKEDYRSLSTSKYLQQLQQAISKSRISQKQLVEGGRSSIKQFILNPLQGSQVKATDRYDERYISPSYYEEHQLYKNYRSKKFSQIEEYLKASNEQKNKKLKKIYGEWKVNVNDINYISYLENSRKGLFRDSTNSNGQEKSQKRNKNKRNQKGQRNQSSQSSSDSSCSSRQRQKSPKKNEPRKKFVKSKQLKKSMSRNAEQIRNDVKKHSSFIIKHKSVGGLLKNPSKELLKFNKEKRNVDALEQFSRKNKDANKFSFIQRKNSDQKPQTNKYSRSLHSRNQPKKVEDTQKAKYKKVQIPNMQSKNTLKKVYSKKEMKFQSLNSKQLQRYFDQFNKKYQRFENQDKQQQEQSIFIKKSQNPPNKNLSQPNKKYFNRERNQFQTKQRKKYYENEDYYQGQTKEDKKQKIYPQNNSKNQKFNQSSSDQNYGNDKKNQYHQNKEAVKVPKREDFLKDKNQTVDQQFQIRNKKTKQAIINSHSADILNQNQRTLEIEGKNQTEIKLNLITQNKKKFQSSQKHFKVDLNNEDQIERQNQLLQKSRNKKQQSKDLGQSQFQKINDERTPINSLINSPNLSRSSSEKDQEIQKSHKLKMSVLQNNERKKVQNQVKSKANKQKVAQQQQMKKQTNRQSNSQHEVKQKQQQQLQNQIKTINDISEDTKQKIQSKSQKKQKVTKEQLLSKKSESKKKSTNYIQENHKKDISSLKNQVKNQQRTSPSKKVENKIRKSQTQAIRQKSPQQKQSSQKNRFPKKIQQKRSSQSIQVQQKKIQYKTKVEKESTFRNNVKTNKLMRSVSSTQHIKDKQLNKSNSNKVHSFFKIEKQTNKNTEVTRLQKGTNFNYDEDHDDEINIKTEEDLIKQSKIDQKLNSVAIQTMDLHQLNKYTNYLQGQKSKQRKGNNSQRTQKSKSILSKNSRVNSVRSSKRSSVHQSIDSLKKKQVIKDIYAPTRLKVDKRKINKNPSQIQKNSIFSSQNSKENSKENSQHRSSSQEKKNVKKNDLEPQKRESNIFQHKENEFQNENTYVQKNTEKNQSLKNKLYNKQEPIVTVNYTRQKALILKQIYNMNQQLQEQQRHYDSLYQENKIYQTQKENQISNEDYLFQQVQNWKDFNQINTKNETIVFLPIEKVINNISQENQQRKTLKLFNPQSIQIHKLKSSSPYLTRNLVRTFHILANKNQLLIARLFQDYKSETNFNHEVNGQQVLIHKKIYGVWLCINKTWRLITVDNIVPAKSHTVEGKEKLESFLLSHQNKQLWPIILQKCLAKAVGSFEKLFSLSVGQLFSLLTGSNYLSYSINENISKNKNFLRQISENDKKNFIMICEKYSSNLKEQNLKLVQDPKIFYLLSKKVVNNGQKEETLFKIKQFSTSSLTSQQPYYMKYDVFCENFKLCEVLHLRQHHNFCSITLNKGSLSTRSGKAQEGSYFNVVQLLFDQQSFGSITVSNQVKSDFRTFLYKLENSDNQIMKLVGQASKNNKKQLFFDCFFQSQKYYLFIQSSNPYSIVTYMGENKPEIKIKQKILSNGLRNKSIEYLPVSSFEEIRLPNNIMGRTSESNLNMSQFQQTFSKKPQSMEDLREMFIEILLQEKRNH